MAHDHLEDEGQTTRRGGVRFVAAGVVGACVLGVGLGLWARPSSIERGDAPAPPKAEVEAALSDRRLQIVLDDSPAPIGQPLEVMPADTPGMVAPEPEPAPAEPQLPKGPPAGLMKVDAPAAAVVALPAVIPAVRAEPKPEPKPAPKAEAAKAKPIIAKPVVARAEKPTTAKKKAETKVAKAEPKAKETPAKRLAKAEPAKKAKTAEPRKERSVKLAKADAPKSKGKPDAKAEKPAKLTKLVKAVKAAPKKLKANASATAERKKKRDLQLAEAREAKRARAKAEKAGKAKAKPAVEKASTPKKKPAPRGEGPMRVARNDGCASADPGEALVCADPRLNQRDRQLQRALRDAEAAGVPASALRRQQERLRQARAAAARDGSWAVEDVYEARIAELNDLARDARDY